MHGPRIIYLIITKVPLWCNFKTKELQGPFYKRRLSDYCSFFKILLFPSMTLLAIEFQKTCTSILLTFNTQGNLFPFIFLTSWQITGNLSYGIIETDSWAPFVCIINATIIAQIFICITKTYKPQPSLVNETRLYGISYVFKFYL